MALVRSFGKALLVSVLTLCSVSADSEGTVSEAALTEKLRFYASIRSLEADFKQLKELREMDMEMRSEGRLTLKRPDTVIWEVLKPARVKVELGAKEIRITSGEGPAASREIYSVDQMPGDKGASSLRDLVAWLKLDAHALHEQYAITRSSNGNYVFVPRKAGPFRSMEMNLAKAGHLETLILNESSGDRMTLKFAKPRVVRAVKDKHP